MFCHPEPNGNLRNFVCFSLSCLCISTVWTGHCIDTKGNRLVRILSRWEIHSSFASTTGIISILTEIYEYTCHSLLARIKLTLSCFAKLVEGNLELIKLVLMEHSWMINPYSMLIFYHMFWFHCHHLDNQLLPPS